MKICKRCGLEKGDGGFSIGRPECKVCNAANARDRRSKNPDRFNQAARRWKKANPDKVKDTVLRYMYGITLEDFKRMETSQGGKCAICLSHRKLFVDHCHKTGRVRGLLCPRCNAYLGTVNDSVDALYRAIKYLQMG